MNVFSHFPWLFHFALAYLEKSLLFLVFVVSLDRKGPCSGVSNLLSGFYTGQILNMGKQVVLVGGTVFLLLGVD